MNNKKILILHDELPKEITEDEKDTLIQVATISETLKKLGYLPSVMPVGLNFTEFYKHLKEVDPFIVFNLVESLDRKSSLIHFVPALLESKNIVFTGSGEKALFLSTNKTLSKQLMLLSGIRTPEWQMVYKINTNGIAINPPFIVKPSGEDASKDITDQSVCFTEEQYFKVIGNKELAHLSDFFIEAFIEGREISISLLASNNTPEVLPPSEIIFHDFPENKPHIVNYNAKWCENTFEYSHTPRTFDFSDRDKPLLEQLKKMACKCWNCFSLRGYARVDFRVDKNNKPWVIDINANPCLSPDSGFIATAIKAGYTYEGIITRILDDAYFNCQWKQRIQHYE